VACWNAWTHPVGSYSYDEQFSFQNVRRALKSDRVIPDWYLWYAPLSYLPQTWLLRGVDAVAVELRAPGLRTLGKRRGSITRFGVSVARTLGIVYGLATLGALFALGRRLGGEWLGALAAVLLAGSPWFTYAISNVKPDPLLLAATVGSLLALTTFAAGGSERHFWSGAVLLGVATAAKLNGAVLAVAVVVAALRDGFDRRAIRRMVGAGALSLAVELLLNPLPRKALDALFKIHGFYNAHEGVDGPGEMLGAIAALLARQSFLGPVFLAAALMAPVLLLHRARRRGSLLRDSSLMAWWPSVSFASAYLLFLALTSSYPKDNHVLQVLPIVALAAAATIEIGRRRLLRSSRRSLAVGLVGATTALSFGQSLFFLARTETPLPRERVARDLARRFRGARARTVGWSSPDGEILPLAAVGGTREPTVFLRSAAELAKQDVAANFDCIAGEGVPPGASPLTTTYFPDESLPPLPWPKRWLPGRSTPTWSGCRPWRSVGSFSLQPTRDDARGWRAAPTPDLPEYDAWSVEIVVRGGDGDAVLLGGTKPLELGFTVAGTREGKVWTTTRVEGVVPAELVYLRDQAPDQIEMTLFLWLRPR